VLYDWNLSGKSNLAHAALKMHAFAFTLRYFTSRIAIPPKLLL